MRGAPPERARGGAVGVRLQDEARVGQQGPLTRVWARRGTRPRAPRDRRHAWAYLFGAVCPERAVGAGLVLPHADTAAMGLHPEEVGRRVAPRARTPWWSSTAPDGAARRAWPSRTTSPSCPCRPAHPPGLSPVENVRQHLRQNQLGPRVWPDYDAIVATCCAAWNALVASPDRLASATRREWAGGVGN